MNLQECRDYEINYLLDRLKETGFSKFRLMDRIKGKSQEDSILILRQYTKRYTDVSFFV